MKQKNTRPLSEVAEGEMVKVLSIDSGRGLRSRLTTMGILPKTELKVLRNSGRGPFVVGIKASRMVLGRGVAKKIMVL